MSDHPLHWRKCRDCPVEFRCPEDSPRERCHPCGRAARYLAKLRREGRTPGVRRKLIPALA